MSYACMGYGQDVPLEPPPAEGADIVKPGPGEVPPPDEFLPGLTDRVIQQAVAAAMQHAWPQIREHIKADIPYLIEEAQPHIQTEVNRAALMIGGISLGALAVTAATVYYLCK